MFDGLICGVLEVPEPDSRLLQTHVDGDLRRRNWGGQIAHAHQIVGGAGESENPIYLAHATMANFPHQRNRLQPAGAFVDSFPLSGGIDGRPTLAYIASNRRDNCLSTSSTMAGMGRSG